jgi:hypothetical protein
MRSTPRVSPRNLAVVWNAVPDPVDLEIDPNGHIRPIRQEEPARTAQQTRAPRPVSFQRPPLVWD